MERRVIFVRAAPGGWLVSSDLLGGPLMFLSGARAEREACRLAKAAAASGRRVAVMVHDRAERLAACIEVPAAAEWRVADGWSAPETDRSPSAAALTGGAAAGGVGLVT